MPRVNPNITEQRLAALYAVQSLSIYRLKFIGFYRKSGRRKVDVSPQQTRALNWLLRHRLAVADVAGLKQIHLIRLTEDGQATLAEWSQ